jgi:translation initiation factor 5B
MHVTKIRSPIIVCVGHVDHGKTTLLDKIRGTTVTALEPGMLSQHTGASYIPLETVKKICGDLLKKLKTEITIPGLLLIDTPGHMAFLGMRKRGGSVSDIAILVVDVTEGFQEQTDESLTILKEFKTPFVVAATKIDKIPGWYPYQNASFIESFSKQREDVKDDLDKKTYQIVSQLAERGFNAERFDRVDDFTKQITIIPVSSITGEGIPELLMVLSGLSQQFLKERLSVSEVARGSVLEVKETKGFGTTIDVILYDGTIRKGDYLIVGGKEPIITKIKALLRPRPLQELRVEKQFEAVDKVSAAAGIKVSAPNLENVISGSPIISVKDENKIEEAKKLVQKEVEEVIFTKQVEGVVIKADTLGSLEAMIKILNEENVPIRKAEVGTVNRQDIIESESVKDSLRKVVLAFNVKVLDDAKTLAKDLGIKVFESNIIYRLMDGYKEWALKKKEREIQEKLENVFRPCEIRFLRGFIFRQHSPAVFGVEVLKGVLKTGTTLKKGGKIIGKVKEIQKEGQSIPEAKRGDKVAVSMEEPVIGRHINEGDKFTAAISEEDVKVLKEVWDYLSEDEKELLNQ